MKRLWFAALFMAVCASLCIGEQLYIKDFVEKTSLHIEYAELYLRESDSERLKKETDEIKRIWDKRNNTLLMLTRHNELDALGEEIRILGTQKDGVNDSLEKIKALIYIFYENQSISFANIL